MRRTTFGFAVAVLGGNIRAAQLAGLATARLSLAACIVGGAAAGLAGAIEIVAVHGAASESLVVGFGYGGILIAFLARQNPLAVIPVAILVGGRRAWIPFHETGHPPVRSIVPWPQARWPIFASELH
jgi:ABC-type uncharacterized transport system permease subunit